MKGDNDQPGEGIWHDDDFFAFLEDIYDRELEDLKARISGPEGLEAQQSEIKVRQSELGGMFRAAALCIAFLTLAKRCRCAVASRRESATFTPNCRDQWSFSLTGS